MAHVLHLLPHPGGGGERQHRLIAEHLPQHQHEFAALAGRQELPRALPGLLFRRPFLASRARNTDLVHIDGDAAAVLSTNVVGRRPYVITTAGLHLLRRSTGRYSHMIQRRLRSRVLASRATMCTSQAEFDELRDLCGSDAPLELVRNGVPEYEAPPGRVRQEARRVLGLADDEVVVLMVTRLEGRKRPLLAARAVTRARSAGAPVVLLVAGDGPLRGDLNAMAGPAVRPLGFREDVDELLAVADLFVLVSDREGMSIGLLQAMAAGLPAIVSDGLGNPEVVGEEAGIVVPAGNEEALVAAVLALANDPRQRQAIGAAARLRVRREFSLAQMLAGVENAYQRCLV